MNLTDIQYQECKKAFVALKEEAFNLNHYQLAEITNIKDPLMWREFLMDPKTIEYVSSEMALIRNAAINQMVQKAPNSNSVGQSQLINALQKIEESNTKKEGPAFIYCFVPLNEAQNEAPNVRELHTNITQEEDGTFVMELESDEE